MALWRVRALLSRIPASVTFWQAPRKTAARRWIFNIHFYGGLIAGLLWLVVGLTGSVIVFVPELRRLEAPGWTRVEPTGQPLALETLWQRVHKGRPADKMASIYFDFKPTWAWNFRSVADNGDRIHTFVDQYRGHLLASVNYNHSLLQWVYDLHADLLGGQRGREVNAWFAFALCVVTSGGVLLWWRGCRYWKRGFEYRAAASWKRQAWDLHNLGGFCFYLPLLLLSLSGAYFAFQPAFTSVAAMLTGGPAVIPPPQVAARNGPRRSLDEILESARRALPDSAPSMIIFPANPSEAFSLRMRRSSDPHRLGLNWVYVDPASARVLRVDRFDRQPRGVQLIRLMIPLHYGTIGGLFTRVLWVVAGLMPGVLFSAALLMWWNRVLSKKRRARKPAAAELRPAAVSNLPR
ncbi:MAG: hypothetical protein A3J28_04760 [Acidobacteria bacterium RIFCSPLOWO2_12_FULL_60_22]|nr:MAG: hypothetical protein A3J28_04760 [Acidobacteria bacterium RIFCSPLOWO2_12_FULL_60_22]